MASLFGKKKLDALASEVSTEEIQDKLEIVRRWHDDYHRGSLKADKETSREQAYNSDFFMRILGYAEKPSTPFTFEPKATTEKKQLPDAVLGYTDAVEDVANISAVVELKGAAVDLDKPQRRDGNMSPVQQGFKYKSQYRTCPFVIVSNFYELRIYQEHQLDYESWTLDDLINPANDFYQFKTFYGLLRAEAFTAPRGKSATEKLLSAFREEQESIGRDFYQTYRVARLELLRDIYSLNEDTRSNFDLAIQKGQKIVDRVIFACFAEDKGLLPDNILHGVTQDAANASLLSLWDILKSFFAAVDSGSDRLGIPIGYNGGLFAHDPELNSLKISDSALRKVLSLSKYDFNEDLSVNILGHIFEQSITDLEEIRRSVEDKQAGEALDELHAISKRKADGIFYTPDYIVRYIVANTVGEHLRQVELKLMAKNKLSAKRTDHTYDEAEAAVYREYQIELQQIQVIDPACGSGAFLVHVLDYLMAENRRVAAILDANLYVDETMQALFSVDDMIDKILRTNIFGVDINEESVEITKLSLWLKTARPGHKLTALDNNIRCGNSLISDDLVDPQKAFDYSTAFKHSFEGDGFHVVVGNPPYVSAMDLSRYLPDAQRKYLKKNYKVSRGAVDLYIYFFELGLKLLRTGGKLGYISPNRYLSASYGRALREYIVAESHLRTLIDYSDKNVFEDASTYPVITLLDKLKPVDGETYEVMAGRIDEESSQAVTRAFDSSMLTKLDDNIMGFLLNDRIDVTLKVFGQDAPLERAAKINATSTAGEADDYSQLVNEEGRGLKIINTGTIDPDLALWGLHRFKNQGTDYMEPYLDVTDPIVSSNRRNLYQSPKIIIAKIGLRCEAFYDENGEYASINTNCLHTFSDDYNPWYVQAWLGSTLYSYVFECLFDGLRMSGGYMLYSAPNLRNTPVPKTPLEEQTAIAAVAEKVAVKRQELRGIEDKFKNFVLHEVGLERWPQKLARWWETDFFEFVKLLKYKGSLRQKESLQEYFDDYCVRVAGVVSEIDAMDMEIDSHFYEIHALTLPEVDHVDASRKR
ncbi:N-6 DNA methylase [Paeniglutamicibacter sp. ABSL32-1]|uniref:Eco57I restriction-modification methylase domain-containing protein n=1 Tax=Paeniglutamicibacter quisquiliarum TaxID=2849498 RepID=UPI001C2D13D9|nr:N-6 DNA methylase [Paeniglutamicibacter quisquiliarum]